MTPLGKTRCQACETEYAKARYVPRERVTKPRGPQRRTAEVFEDYLDLRVTGVPHEDALHRLSYTVDAFRLACKRYPRLAREVASLGA